MSSDDDNFDFGQLISFAIIFGLFAWATKTPKRILLFSAALMIVVIPMMIKDKAEAKERALIQKERASTRAYEDENQHYIWLRKALTIQLWESYLGSIPAVAQSQDWEKCTLGIGRLEKRDIRRLVKHTQIQEFVETVLPEWLDTAAMNNPILELKPYTLQEAMDWLHLGKDSVGIYVWSERNYGMGEMYRYVSPALAINEGNIQSLKHLSGLELDLLAREIQQKYLTLKRKIAVEDYENNELLKTIRRAEKYIQKSAPELPPTEAKAMVLKVVQDSYQYRKFRKQFPDYTAMEANYFAELL